MTRGIGVFGGTFDPPHVGHLASAEWAREQLGLAQVLFVPAGRPPHKGGRAISPARHRVAMTRLAVRDHSRFEVSTWEASRPGPSFTVETLRALKDLDPGARLFLLIGEDSLDEFRTWREPEAILELATLAVAGRPGSRRRGRRPPFVALDNPGIAISSSLLRARARAGRSLRYLVPDAVAAYIRRHHLYRSVP